LVSNKYLPGAPKGYGISGMKTPHTVEEQCAAALFEIQFRQEGGSIYYKTGLLLYVTDFRLFSATASACFDNGA